MSNDSFELVLCKRIKDIEARRSALMLEVGKCDTELSVLKSLKSDISKENTRQEILKRSKPANLLDKSTVKKINIFLEFMDKCGDEKVYTIANRKMSKIGYNIHKTKLWASWPAFRADFEDWLNRRGEYEGVLEKVDKEE